MIPLDATHTAEDNTGCRRMAGTVKSSTGRLLAVASKSTIARKRMVRAVEGTSRPSAALLFRGPR